MSLQKSTKELSVSENILMIYKDETNLSEVYLWDQPCTLVRRKRKVKVTFASEMHRGYPGPLELILGPIKYIIASLKLEIELSKVLY